MNPHSFSLRLSALRVSKGFKSLAALAAVCGVTPQMLGRYERGESRPGFDVLCALADALGVTVDALVRGSN